MKNKIVVLYHRPPYSETLVDGKLTFQQNNKPNGIIPLLKNYFSANANGVWIAGSSFGCDEAHPVRELVNIVESGGSCMLRRVCLSREEVHSFYHRTSKEGFWPILHSFPEKFNYDAIDWPLFKEINKRFAKAACEEADDNTVIWVHDYNLWLAPYYIRKEKPDVKIAFFFHTPFPSQDIFNILPWRKHIIESLLSCDLCNFDIPRYVENFVATAGSIFDIYSGKREPVEEHFSRSGAALSEPYITKLIRYKGRTIRLNAVPEGTNIDLITKVLARPSTVTRIADIEQWKNGTRLIFAASRTDYIKGTVELLDCYQRLLARNPAIKEQVTLFVVAVEPAEGITAYDLLQEKIHQQVGEINGRYGTLSWQPVLYSGRALNFEEMISWFYAADIMWVPSLRDGMNIICKEFIATKHDKEGVLVLSEFAGAAVELEDAVLVNPYSPSGMDSGMDIALSMPAREQKERQKRMFNNIKSSDITVWSRQLDLFHCMESDVLSEDVI